MDSRTCWIVSLTIVACFFYLFVTSRPATMALRARLSSRSGRFVSSAAPIPDRGEHL
jgi:hypothetical protein